MLKKLFFNQKDFDTLFEFQGGRMKGIRVWNLNSNKGDTGGKANIARGFQTIKWN